MLERVGSYNQGAGKSLYVTKHRILGYLHFYSIFLRVSDCRPSHTHRTMPECAPDLNIIINQIDNKPNGFGMPLAFVLTERQ